MEGTIVKSGKRLAGSGVCTSLLAWAMASALMAQEGGINPTRIAREDVGQELQRLERTLRDSEVAPDHRVPALMPDALAQLEADESVIDTATGSQADVEADAERILEEAIESAAATAEEAAEGAEAETGAATDEPSGATAEEAAAEEESTDSSDRPRTVRPRRATAGSYVINSLTVTGDKEFLEDLGLMADLESEIVGQELTRSEIDDIARRYSKIALDEGFYLARVQNATRGVRQLSEGEVVIDVDKGRVGNVTFYEQVGDEQVPFRGKHYSEKQLRLRMTGIEEGNTFRYDDFYANVFSVNSHPDLTMDTNLKVRRERLEERASQSRFVDIDFVVDDTLPIHGVFEIQNSGTEATDEWRAGVTLQHLNLTKRDDVLTLTLPFSLDLKTIRSVAASYYIPHHYRKGGSFTVFGGYSELDAEDLVPSVNLAGEGYFAGIQASYDAYQSDAHSLQLSFGYTYQVIEDTLVLGSGVATPRAVTVAPLNFVITYSSVRPDRYGGRNFLTSQSNLNIGGALGSSNDEEFTLQRETAEADYFIERLQFARIQPLALEEPDPEKAGGRQWLVFLKLDGQIASGALIPAETKAVGGLDNVRGYTEREILGDHGLSWALELRSPIWTGNYFGKMGKYPDAAGGSERLQLVAFCDGAVMFIDDTVPGVKDQFELLSIGLGIRLSVTRYTQLKFDWGFPIEETLESDSSGRGHVSFEMQI